MQAAKLSVFALGVIALAVSAGARGQGPHWGYSGETGPEHWGNLDPAYEVCGSGRNQSPIDLAGFVEADLKALTFDYKPGTSEILNNGHTVQINYASGSSITVDGNTFELKQFHFHAPSENTLNGEHFPMEGHLVHADEDGNLAVVAVMFQEGDANALLTRLWEQMPGAEGEKNTLSATDSVSPLLPTQRDYYRFNGSLTTPPCSEGVWWLVIKQPASASKAQIEQFTTVMGHPNNRSVQAVNARPVLQ